MHVSDLGEFKLIESISRMTKNEGDLVSLGIGDDAAVLRISEGREFVISVDESPIGMVGKVTWPSAANSSYIRLFEWC